MKKYLLPISTALLMSLFISSTFADEPSGIHPLLSDRFIIGGGIMAAHLDGEVSRDTKDRDGTNIDLQDDLGFADNETLWAINFRWRITDRSQLSFSYLDIDQGNSISAEKTINWGDLEFQAGAAIDSTFDLSLLRAFYGYSLYKTDQAEFGIGGGLHLVDLETKLAGIASINGNEATFGSESSDLLAPLPNVGIYGGYAFSPKWYVGAYADWFSLEYGDYDGSLLGFGANVQYQAFKHVGFGLGYQYLNFNIEVDKSDWKGGADTTFYGPSLFMTVNF